MFFFCLELLGAKIILVLVTVLIQYNWFWSWILRLPKCRAMCTSNNHQRRRVIYIEVVLPKSSNHIIENKWEAPSNCKCGFILPKWWNKVLPAGLLHVLCRYPIVGSQCIRSSYCGKHIVDWFCHDRNQSHNSSYQ